MVSYCVVRNPASYEGDGWNSALFASSFITMETHKKFQANFLILIGKYYLESARLLVNVDAISLLSRPAQ
jgi:hypothetical protein